MKTRTSKSRGQDRIAEPRSVAISDCTFPVEATKKELQSPEQKSDRTKYVKKGKDYLDDVLSDSKSVHIVFGQDNQAVSTQPACSISSKKAGARKGRSLDLVVRRMLKAKKRGKEVHVSREAKQKLSSKGDITSPVSSRESEYLIGLEKAVTVSFPQSHQKLIDSVPNEGMIDVHLSSDGHLSKIGVSSSTGPVPDLSSETHISSDLCPNAASDNESSCFKNLVSSIPSLETERLQGEVKTMTPIIKQESAVSSCVPMYHQNGPAEIHSPSSSCHSHPSPEHGTPSPNSPVELNDEGSYPQESSLHQGMSEVTPSNTDVLILNGTASSRMPMYISNPLGFIRRSPNNHSPSSSVAGARQARERGNMRITAAAMAASEMGLPTLVPSLSAVPPSTSQSFFRIGAEQDLFDGPTRRLGNEPNGVKVSPNAPTGPHPSRGIVGQKEAAAANESRGRRGCSVDEKCPYKRPPHTYPALIASAILDSPGNLITLRGIYDYIMNNFPYYKFGHDKSAWQNSIRHNLSLNQCFVKVPRYENAAKSNYWTMTREGFEEFGNENSFKRRRRRGAALAPISAYKNKKSSSNEGPKGSKLKGPHCNGTRVVVPNMARWQRRPGSPESEEDYKSVSHTTSKTLKRAGSPGVHQSDEKHPRMLVLKQGEGPTIEGLGRQTDRPRRPNSLSSVEEMQGNLNSFSKTLCAVGDHSISGDAARKNDRHSHAEIFTKQWMLTAMHKNLNLFPPGILPVLTPSSPSLTNSFDRNSALVQGNSAAEQAARNTHTPVMIDGIEIGYQVPVYAESTGSKRKLSYYCRFCEFTHIDQSSSALEQHCHMLHPLELTNARAKVIAAAAVAGRRKDVAGGIKSPSMKSETASTLPNVVSGVSSSMLAVAASYNNAQNLLAAAQAAGLSLPMSGSYPSTFAVPNVVTAGMPHMASLSRVLTQNIGPGTADISTQPGDVHQQLSAAVSVADSSNMTQEQIRRLVYQQLIGQNPFFPGNTPLAASLRPSANPQNEMAQLAHLWQYQQKVLEMAVQSVSEKTQKMSDTAQKEPISDRPLMISPNRKRRESTSSNCSHQHEQHSDADTEERQDDIHGWKQCQNCAFTAKGAHGLELHSRKVHGSDLAKEGTCTIKIEDCDGVTEGKSIFAKDTSEEIDLKVGNGERRVNRNTVQALRTDSSTQTADTEEQRTCKYCDVTFGDDTMYALHMTCHDRDNPYKCKICEKDCHEKYYFNVHLLRGLHQPRYGAVENERHRPSSTEHAPGNEDKEHYANEMKSDRISPCPLTGEGDTVS